MHEEYEIFANNYVHYVYTLIQIFELRTKKKISDDWCSKQTNINIMQHAYLYIYINNKCIYIKNE